MGFFEGICGFFGILFNMLWLSQNERVSSANFLKESEFRKRVLQIFEENTRKITQVSMLSRSQNVTNIQTFQ